MKETELYALCVTNALGEDTMIFSSASKDILIRIGENIAESFDDPSFVDKNGNKITGIFVEYSKTNKKDGSKVDVKIEWEKHSRVAS